MLNIDLTNKSLVSKVYSKISPEKGKVLNFYDEVMFFGLNEKGDVLLCLCTENNDNGGQLVEAVIDKDTLKDFVKSKITYLEVLKKAPMIFISYISMPKDIDKTYLVTINDLPDDFLSHIDRPCPDLTKENYYSFLVKREIDN